MAKISAEEREASRLRILNASLIVFRRNGFEKTQIKEIAKEAGVGTSTIYGYYASKVELFVAAFVDEVLGLEFDESKVASALEKGITEGLLKLFFEDRVKSLLEDKELLRSFVVASLYNPSELMAARKCTNRAKQYEFIKSVLEIYERTNIRLCAFSLNHLAEAILTIVEQIGMQYMVDEIALEDAEEKIKNQVRVMLAGKYSNL